MYSPATGTYPARPRWLVVGAEGLLGSAVARVAAADPRVREAVRAGRGDADVTSPEQVRRLLSATRPDVVVNAAVFTGVAACETSPERAYQVNAVGARVLATACAERRIRCVYLSTDYVFDGTAATPYDETAPPHPVQTYGVTKLAGERETLNAEAGHLVVRTAALFGPPPPSTRRRPGFLEQILRQAAAGHAPSVVDSLVMSPTYTLDLARVLVELVAHEVAGGPYHLVNEGSASWYELASAAVGELGLPALPRPAPEAPGPKPRRPHRTPLATARVPATAQRLNRPWRKALRAFLGEHGAQLLAAARAAGPPPGSSTT
ncbi:dTDP-4-dehydrorhamnose reductase [Streptomyces sp. 891-h]|uniref:dTDP-4-dehydrorhamnose reductase n=1 Tax=unclassified Streptomyces TaxID=2593676 RepID=UPI001FA97489|nr:dTDP-4-dehydrorhamnose reductase [Streptomyces sp. 891-h]UNZ20462.1 dTDP-4-dehydrorhamnose reductase [Streptomyces sp. 891-h]